MSKGAGLTRNTHTHTHTHNKVARRVHSDLPSFLYHPLSLSLSLSLSRARSRSFARLALCLYLVSPTETTHQRTPTSPCRFSMMRSSSSVHAPTAAAAPLYTPRAKFFREPPSPPSERARLPAPRLPRPRSGSTPSSSSSSSSSSSGSHASGGGATSAGSLWRHESAQHHGTSQQRNGASRCGSVRPWCCVGGKG